ncbi:MAG TPA: choice-of-anchor tandem repeat GloVer-containing protein [Candidatus Cybelea sp.]|nr:choice-of-anchor tandem repeat GloVer-containing protein [Candidatus Cybelea sp.]
MRFSRYAGLAALILAASCGRGAGVSPTLALPANTRAALGSSKIAHVVIIVQENRSVDNLFNGLPGADTARFGLNSKGKKVPLAPIPLTEGYDLGHTHQSWEVEYAKGKLDGFSQVDSRCYTINICIAADVRAYGYVPRSEAAPYFTMASRYAFADRMFQTNEGPSFPAHQYLISGTSAIANGSTWRASDNPASLTGNPTGGCDSPSGSLVPAIDLKDPSEKNYVFPCFNRLSLMDLLDAKSLSWRYYQAKPGAGLWDAPDAILGIRKSAEFATDVVSPPTQVLKDVASGNLADVVWVTPAGLYSDHARSNSGAGPSWVAAVVNAIGKSSYWNDTAIFVTWDDWGGWYDHVPPPQFNPYELSFRVPLIAISPYSKAHYVSHVQHEFGSILKFTEEVFGLPSMHTTDERADDLADMFDFTQSPAKFERIPAPLPPKYFLKQPLSGGAPDDDASAYSELYSFGENGKSNDGDSPASSLESSGGTLYGTTQYGGTTGAGCPDGCGTVFSVTPGGAERVLYRFPGGSGGALPVAGVAPLGSLLYGTTSSGGSGTNCAGGCGTIFSIDPTGKNESVVHSFAGGSDGAYPVGSPLGVNGALYGVTQEGGAKSSLCAAGCGTIYRISASGTESVIHAFKGGSDGASPFDGLVESGGALYGTTQYGGKSTPFCGIGCGTVFKIDTSSGAFSIVYRFRYAPQSPDGAFPSARVLVAGGTLYGTTLGGGAYSQGSVFKISGSGVESVLHSFVCCKTASDGTSPQAGLIADAGTLYGTTRHGGASGKGVIFSISYGGSESVVYSFGDRPDGAQPIAALDDLSGVLYGTTAYGGSVSEGSLFALSP